MTRQTVDQLIAEVIRKEGGYSNHPADKGGETNLGVTVAVARKYGYHGPMHSLPRGVAEDIYRRRYFIEPGFDKVHAVSIPVAEELFDTGVNMGTSVPGKWLQRILNVLDDRVGDLVVDGDIGPATIGSLRAVLARRGAAGELVIVRALNCLQGNRYIELAEARDLNKTFIYGWLLNRVGAV